jgi:hypothetical protein
MQLLKFFCAISFLPWLNCTCIGFEYLTREFNKIKWLLDDNIASVFIIYESTTVGDLEQSEVQEFTAKIGEENVFAKTFTLGQK